MFPICLREKSFRPHQTSGRLFAGGQMQNCANCMLNMQHSRKHTCINVELRISNQQTNIRSGRHSLRHCCHAQVLLHSRVAGYGLSKRYVALINHICVGVFFLLSGIKMTHYCSNPVGQHDEAIKRARQRLILLSEVSFALQHAGDFGELAVKHQWRQVSSVCETLNPPQNPR